MKRNLSVAQGVAWRTLHNVFTNPSLVIPQLAFPLFFFTAFVGGLSRIHNVPGFHYAQGYTAFQFVFVLLQSAAFAVSSRDSGSRATSRPGLPGACCLRRRIARAS